MFAIRSTFRLLATLAFVALIVPLHAQTYPIEGYINRVQPPNGFQVSGRWFFISPNTDFGFMGTNSASRTSPVKDTLRVGVYVQVAGRETRLMGPIIATTVFAHDQWNENLSGFGVITRVVSPGPNAVFDADGYRIRITPSTKLDFDGDASSVDEITPNSWMSFSGKRGKDGAIEATKAHFVPAKPTKFKAIKNLEIVAVKTRPAGTDDKAQANEGTGTLNLEADGTSLQNDQEVKLGFGRWRTLPADQPLQQRVHHIGMALVPAYQRELADDDPSKIHFRFFAFDDKKSRNSIYLLDGAVLVSKLTVERLSNDNQLAAIIADGIAYNLQRQAAKEVKMNRILWGADAALAFAPGMGMAVLLANESAEATMLRERLRISLALMRDAGFDPWQAPEAWRLIEPKKLPANPALMDYPDASCYQFQVLDLQYPRN